MTDLPLKDRIALVVGASRGIGYESALALAKAGAHVIATGRTQGGLEDLDDAIYAATRVDVMKLLGEGGSVMKALEVGRASCRERV